MPAGALRQHIVHIRQHIVRHDDAHPTTLSPPAVRALKAHDRLACPPPRGSFGTRRWGPRRGQELSRRQVDSTSSPMVSLFLSRLDRSSALIAKVAAHMEPSELGLTPSCRAASVDPTSSPMTSLPCGQGRVPTKRCPKGTAAADSLKALDLEWPIREAEVRDLRLKRRS